MLDEDAHGEEMNAEFFEHMNKLFLHLFRIDVLGADCEHAHLCVLENIFERERN